MSTARRVTGAMTVVQSREQQAYVAWLNHTICCQICQPDVERCPEGDQLHGALRKARREARR